MISHALKRLFRSRISGIGIFLFGLILTAVLCGLRAANEEEIRNYDKTYHLIPVKLTVTNLSATKSNELDAPGWVVDVFTGEVPASFHLQKYAKDLRIVSRHFIEYEPGRKLSMLVGMTSLSLAPELLPENGASIQWREGYDESIFSGDELVCLIPESIAASENIGEEITLPFAYQPDEKPPEPRPPRRECELTFRVAGVFSGVTEPIVFCPYACVELVYEKLTEDRNIYSLSATLSDNDLLDALRTDRKYWFAEPNPLGEETRWDFLEEYYPYALDINDELLVNAAATLQNSILVNQICAVLVFVLAAGAGGLVGFLVIRQQKREINLMRAMGTSQLSIFGGYVFEQMLCLLAGTVVGGACWLWRPLEQVGAFVGLYLMGLVISLGVSLRRNLLSTIKEDE